jgi:hypothetical protein
VRRGGRPPKAALEVARTDRTLSAILGDALELCRAVLEGEDGGEP